METEITRDMLEKMSKRRVHRKLKQCTVYKDDREVSKSKFDNSGRITTYIQDGLTHNISYVSNNGSPSISDVFINDDEGNVISNEHYTYNDNKDLIKQEVEILDRNRYPRKHNYFGDYYNSSYYGVDFPREMGTIYTKSEFYNNGTKYYLHEYTNYMGVKYYEVLDVYGHLLLQFNTLGYAEIYHYDRDGYLTSNEAINEHCSTNKYFYSSDGTHQSVLTVLSDPEEVAKKFDVYDIGLAYKPFIKRILSEVNKDYLEYRVSVIYYGDIPDLEIFNTFNEDGYLIHYKDSRGYEYHYDFDNDGNIIRFEDNNGKFENWTYTEEHRILTIETNDHLISYEYEYWPTEEYEKKSTMTTAENTDDPFEETNTVSKFVSKLKSFVSLSYDDAGNCYQMLEDAIGRLDPETYSDIKVFGEKSISFERLYDRVEEIRKILEEKK